MLANKIHLQRLVERRHRLHRFVDGIDAVGEVVAGDAGDTNGQIDPGPSQLFQRDDLEALQPSVGLPDRLRAQEEKHLGHVLAIGPHDIAAHPVEGNVLRTAAFLLLVLGDDGPAQLLADLPGGLGGHAVGVQRVEVPARGQDIVTAPGHKTAGSRLDVAAVHAVQQGLDLQRCINPGLQVQDLLPNGLELALISCCGKAQRPLSGRSAPSPCRYMSMSFLHRPSITSSSCPCDLP